MTSPALETYLVDVDAEAAPALTALDAAITDAHPGFDIAVKYKILMYALNRDWRHWVCAINATKNGVCLRFLYGVMLEDPHGVLRPGTSTLKTWDFRRGDDIDPAAVGAYVREAVGRYADYRANAREVTEAARAAAQQAKRPKG